MKQEEDTMIKRSKASMIAILGVVVILAGLGAASAITSKSNSKCSVIVNSRKSYCAGTITQSGNTITGTGTAFTRAMNNGTIYYSDGSNAQVGFISGTSLTSSAMKTIPSGSTYSLVYGPGVYKPTAPVLASSPTGGALAGDRYYYELAATGSYGTTAAVASQPISVTTAGSTSQNTLSWKGVSGAVGYVVYRSDNDKTWQSISVGPAVTSIQDNGTLDWQ
jgi:hypothetical protein